ncbi:hypothetical protein V2S84_12325, partial [Azotobacter chroococcum]|nr:hypothetical protein [Azotobacter chroococcum]
VDIGEVAPAAVAEECVGRQAEAVPERLAPVVDRHAGVVFRVDFQDLLHQAGHNVTVRTTRGDDIDAACGQLVGQVMDRTRRSERHIAVRQLGDEAAPSASAVNRT